MQRREALLLIGLSPLLACSRGRLSSDAPIELVIPSEAATIDPRYTSDVYGLRVAHLVHATLAAPDPITLAPVPYLAESIDDAEQGAVIVTLRRGAVFHDGTPITARDVIATFEAARDPSLGMPARRIAIELADVRALDGPTGKRILIAPRSPRAVLRADLDLPILKAEEARRPRGTLLVGSGPFEVASVARGAIGLRPSSTHGTFHSRHARRSVVVRSVRDEAARALRLLGGGADVASNALSAPLALGLPQRSDAPSGLAAAARPSASTTFLVINVTRAPLDVPEVRRAIGLSIDRQAIITAKLGAAARVASGLTPPTIALAIATAPVQQDAAHARAVLSPLGRTGARLTMVASNDRGRVSIARAIAQMISDAGIPVDLRTYDLATLLARLGSGDFDLAPMVASEIGDPELLRWYLHSSAIPPDGANRSRLRDRDVDSLLDRGLATLDPNARRAIYGDLEGLVRVQAPIVPLWHEDNVAVTSARAHAFAPSADGRWAALADLA